MTLEDAVIMIAFGSAFLSLTGTMIMVPLRIANYYRSGKDKDPYEVIKAKNTAFYAICGMSAAATTLSLIYVYAPPSISEAARSALAVAFSIGLVSPVFTMKTAPGVVAVYSAWWMPQPERTAHRQDMLYALTQARGLGRSRHVWRTLTSSPRAGLRARRHHARLTRATAGEPVVEPAQPSSATVLWGRGRRASWD